MALFRDGIFQVALVGIGGGGLNAVVSAQRSGMVEMMRDDARRAATRLFVDNLARTWTDHFQRMFANADGRLPALTNVFCDHDIANDGYRVRVECEGEEPAASVIHHVDLMNVSPHAVRNIDRTIRNCYSTEYENAYMRRGVRAERERLEDLIRTEADRVEIDRAYDTLFQVEQHIRAYHSQRHPMMNAAAQQNAAEVRAQSRYYQANELLMMQQAMQASSQSHQRHMQDAVMYGLGINHICVDQYRVRASELFGGSEIGTPEARERGVQLLKENLTPAQREQYEAHRHFDVKGSKSKKTYRIKHGRQMNIEELDASGKRVRGLCFLPSSGVAGPLVAGDCMLAQKIALETDETETLKIANKF